MENRLRIGIAEAIGTMILIAGGPGTGRRIGIDTECQFRHAPRLSRAIGPAILDARDSAAQRRTRDDDTALAFAVRLT